MKKPGVPWEELSANQKESRWEHQRKEGGTTRICEETM